MSCGVYSLDSVALSFWGGASFFRGFWCTGVHAQLLVFFLKKTLEPGRVLALCVGLYFGLSVCVLEQGRACNECARSMTSGCVGWVGSSLSQSFLRRVGVHEYTSLGVGVVRLLDAHACGFVFRGGASFFRSFWLWRMGVRAPVLGFFSLLFWGSVGPWGAGVLAAWVRRALSVRVGCVHVWLAACIWMLVDTGASSGTCVCAWTLRVRGVVRRRCLGNGCAPSVGLS